MSQATRTDCTASAQNGIARGEYLVHNSSGTALCDQQSATTVPSSWLEGVGRAWQVTVT